MRVDPTRILREKRALIAPLTIALLANLAATALFVYPLSIRVRDTAARANAAEGSLRAARHEYADAERTRTDKERASEDLKRFYKEVLPADLAGARRISYLRLAQLASKAGLKTDSRTFDTETDTESELGRLKVDMVLWGEYDNVRQFIHALETAPEFVVIEHVSLAQGGEPAASLMLTMELSTYYRLPPEVVARRPAD
jgi:hypothetical protein